MDEREGKRWLTLCMVKQKKKIENNGKREC